MQQLFQHCLQKVGQDFCRRSNNRNIQLGVGSTVYLKLHNKHGKTAHGYYPTAALVIRVKCLTSSCTRRCSSRAEVHLCKDFSATEDALLLTLCQNVLLDFAGRRLLLVVPLSKYLPAAYSYTHLFRSRPFFNNTTWYDSCGPQ